MLSHESENGLEVLHAAVETTMAIGPHRERLESYLHSLDPLGIKFSIEQSKCPCCCCDDPQTSVSVYVDDHDSYFWIGFGNGQTWRLVDASFRNRSETYSPDTMRDGYLGGSYAVDPKGVGWIFVVGTVEYTTADTFEAEKAAAETRMKDYAFRLFREYNAPLRRCSKSARHAPTWLGTKLNILKPGSVHEAKYYEYGPASFAAEFKQWSTV